MKPAALILLFGVASAGADVTRAAERTPFQIRCEDTISKTISVLSTKSNGFTINNQLPYRALTLKTGSIDGRSETLGLTVTRAQYAATMGGPILQDKVSGYECVAPRVEIKLNYSPVLIYVGNEFVPGSCGYKTILEHEQRHLKAYMDNLARVEKVVRDALNRRFEGKPLYAPSGTAQSALQHEINSQWMPFIQAEFDKGKAEQAKIDTPAEYARLANTCNGEIREIVQRRRRR
ncbi:hypothetical protein NHH88_11470 [Oxalobacteraceae bacterium OTU3CAMAD1]|nr:hypothetical protein NHH88_11470 [Oxalobacteraceae bacterium OTU3CAMAD1]